MSRRPGSPAFSMHFSNGGYSMSKLILALTLAALFMPAMGRSQSLLDGTWKIDVSKANFSPKPDVYVLADGMYECQTCVPAFKIKADGMDQAISGNPYIDTVAIKVVDEHTIQETDKKAGKVVGTSTTTVSPDGNAASFTFSDSSNTNGGAPVTGSGTSTKVAPGPPGSHAISGSWKFDKVENLSDNAAMWSYKVNGNQISMTSPTGQSYTATLDGTDAPVTGDPGTTSVSVKMLGANTLEETDKRDGKVIGVLTVTVSADGKTAKIISEDKLRDRTSEFVALKQ